MSTREQGEVLIDQNRNLLTPNWRQCSSSAFTSADYMAQSDKVSHHFQQIPANENTQQKFKVPSINGLPTNAGDSGEQMLTKLKEHPTENADRESVSPKKIVPSNTEGQGDELICENDPDEQQELVSRETIQKRVCLVKLYAWIKEEMSKTAARSIASHLYQSEHKLLSRCDHESILHCSWRREAVEQLLKKVLMGPADIHELFMKALKEQEERHIAEKLDKETATNEEIQVFSDLEWSSLGRCLRPDSNQPRLKFTDSDHQTLMYYLNNKNTIDNINDHLLSRFIFSIREHTNINHCCMDSEKRVKKLIFTMKVCAEHIFKDFCEILSAIEMSHVIGKLEKRNQGPVTCRQRQKRKSTPTEGNDSEPSTSSSSAKRQCFNSTVECRLVTSMQRSSSTLRLQALDQLGFDIENVNKGSIVIQLCSKEPDSWHKLEENCRTGKIKDFIPVVYNNEAVEDLLEEGEYRLKFTIYTLPTQPDKLEKKVMFHLETDQEKQCKEKQEEEKKMTNGHQENLLEECSDLLCEELEINKDLISLLKSEKLVEDNIKEEIDKQGSRSKKIRFLLKKIGSHGMKGYNVLKEYIKEENEDLYKAMVTKEEVKVIDNKMDTAAKVTKNRPTNHRGVYKKEVFFTGTVVLMVKKHVIGKQKGSKSSTEMEITCPEILDPVCYFAETGKENENKSGEVTLVLEEAWSLVGANQPAKREILVGKRKQPKGSASSSKRVHSVLEETDSEVEDTPDCEVETPDTDLKDKSKSPSKSEKGEAKTSVEETESSQKKGKEGKKT
ncbi:uncharacterized protein LOC132749032 isoform X2 [Ruditapes philippinarum]|uniref:uncharacterized protein LOC132749032 isoform X2 n=1 Tax=Ruditapes philippinarum TaxID=129788 RepID=UPI00295A6185|nr:uncharacterized protein LOC132749032 isoform X2 [Ruditapes philippinarum]